MKKYILLFLIFCAPSIWSQELTVKSFQEATKDLSARSGDTKREDLNGNPCALVKVDLPLQGVQFGQNEVVGNVPCQVNTYWVYMPGGAKKLTIMAPGYHTLTVQFSDYGIPYLTGKNTYLMTIDAPQLNPTKKVNTQQYVRFTVVPKTAVLEFDGQSLPLADGVASVRKSFGTYSYTVSANMYHSESGTVTVNDPINRHEVRINLKSASGSLKIAESSHKGADVYLNGEKIGSVPLTKQLASGSYHIRIAQSMYADYEQDVVISDNETSVVTPQLSPLFGFIRIPESGNLGGSIVYIDGKEVGKVPFKSGKLKSGSYKVKIVRPMYTPVEQVCVVENGKTTTVNADIQATFATVTLKAPNDAEIWVNDVAKGRGTWTGDLPYGAYLIEARKPHYHTASREITINKASQNQQYELSAPMPITGSLDINSTPSDANVYLDDKLVGTTPIFLSEVMEGKHTISLRKSGYAEFKQSVNLSENEEKSVHANLSSRNVFFKVTPSNAKIYVNGEEVVDNAILITSPGNYEVTVKAEGYVTNKSTVKLYDGYTYTYDMQKVPITLPGQFSVSPTRKILFSPGNLQYQASTKTWRFAEHQWDCLGDANENISSTYSGWIDLFGWGTSGYNSKYPYMTNKTSTDYGNGSTNISGTNYDWGVYNAISNGGNTKGQWRTLTEDEWTYLLSTRSKSLRSLGTVNGKAGLIILPDNWTKPSDITYTSTTSGYTTNTYTIAHWSKMEANGAAFLPAAGIRNGTSVGTAGSYGFYWSSSYYGTNSAYYLFFDSGLLNPASNYSRRNLGLAVRLVQDIK